MLWKILNPACLACSAVCFLAAAAGELGASWGSGEALPPWRLGFAWLGAAFWVLSELAYWF